MLLAALLVVLGRAQDEPPQPHAHGESTPEQDGPPPDDSWIHEDIGGGQHSHTGITEKGELLPDHSQDHTDLKGLDFGTECLHHAEELERDLGVFDDPSMHEDTMKAIANKMVLHSQIAYGVRQKMDFRDAMVRELIKVRDQRLPYGAVDICNFMISHHSDAEL